jgi:hypothetical protein
MKFSAAFPVVAVLVGWTLVTAYPLPYKTESDLEVRREFLVRSDLSAGNTAGSGSPPSSCPGR